MMIHRFVGTIARLRSLSGRVGETGHEREVFHGIVNNVGAADALERKVGRVVANRRKPQFSKHKTETPHMRREQVRQR